MTISAGAVIFTGLVAAVGCWNIGSILTTGKVSGRSGAEYGRAKDPVMFWICSTAHAIPLAMSTFLITASLGAPALQVLAVAVATEAVELVLIGTVVR